MQGSGFGRVAHCPCCRHFRPIGYRCATCRPAPSPLLACRPLAPPAPWPPWPRSRVSGPDLARSPRPAPSHAARCPARLAACAGGSPPPLRQPRLRGLEAAAALPQLADAADLALPAVGDLSKADLEGKVVFVRADLNVSPLHSTAAGGARKALLGRDRQRLPATRAPAGDSPAWPRRISLRMRARCTRRALPWAPPAKLFWFPSPPSRHASSRSLHPTPVHPSLPSSHPLTPSLTLPPFPPSPPFPQVPLDGDKITDDTRIRAAVPTLKYLVDNGAKVVGGAGMGLCFALFCFVVFGCEGGLCSQRVQRGGTVCLPLAGWLCDGWLCTSTSAALLCCAALVDGGCARRAGPGSGTQLRAQGSRAWQGGRHGPPAASALRRPAHPGASSPPPPRRRCC